MLIRYVRDNRFLITLRPYTRTPLAPPCRLILCYLYITEGNLYAKDWMLTDMEVPMEYVYMVLGVSTLVHFVHTSLALR